MLLFDPKYVLWLSFFSFGILAERFGKPGSSSKVTRRKGLDSLFSDLEEIVQVGKIHLHLSEIQWLPPMGRL